MTIDKALTKPWVTPRIDGDIQSRKGRTQEFLAVEIHSHCRKRVSELRPVTMTHGACGQERHVLNWFM